MSQPECSPTRLPEYVLVTPARNEAELIESTIRSVAVQTIHPVRWAIVSDGSTDGTEEIVQRYAAEHKWIELVRIPERKERHFGGKVRAINAGLACMDGLSYAVIACLDADITFEPDYFEFLLEKLALNPELGVVGTPYCDATSEIYDYRFVSTNHVSGACQVFRRECFEEIGGYVPAKGGAIDSIATLTARMRGWKTRTFTEKISFHHRSVGTAEVGPIRARFIVGKRDYAVGNHPLWQVFRGFYQLFKKPYVLRGLAVIAGYTYAAATRMERTVSRELMAFHRKEQLDRLAGLFSRRSVEETAPRSRRAEPMQSRTR